MRTSLRAVVAGFALVLGCVAVAATPGWAKPASRHGAAPSSGPAHAAHGAATNGTELAPVSGAHGGESVGHELLGFGDVNWYFGVLGVRDGVEPGLLWRPPEMGVPVVALAFNTALLFYLFVRVGRRPLRLALRRRRESILHSMAEATQMQEEAAARLAEQRAKLQRVEHESARITQRMRQTAQVERERILADAKQKRARVQRDARLTIESELRAARAQLMNDLVRTATQSARQLLAQQVTAADQQQVAEAYLASLKTADFAAGGRG